MEDSSATQEYRYQDITFSYEKFDIIDHVLPAIMKATQDQITKKREVMIKRGMIRGNFHTKPYKKRKLEENVKLESESSED